MNHQDWNTISLHNPSKQKVEKNICQRKGDTSIIYEKIKIENDTENFSLSKIPLTLSKEIISVRLKLKKTQKEIANKLNIQLATYNQLENGSAIYSSENKQIINKLEKIFGIRFENKKIIA